MTDTSVRPGNRQSVLALGFVKRFPSLGEEHKAVNNQNVACNVKGSEMGVTTPTKEIFKKVSRIVSEKSIPGNFAESQPERKYIVSGKPYISVNRATMNAENAPNDRQSLGDFGLVKLKAKMIKISELKITNSQRP